MCGEIASPSGLAKTLISARMMINKNLNHIFILTYILFFGNIFLHADEKLTLDECVKHALQNNFDIQIIRKNLSIAQGMYKSARGFYDPSIGLSAMHTHSEEAQVTTIFGTKTKTSTIGLDVHQNIFTGGKITLSAEGEKIDSNSIFATLNPSYKSKLSLDVSQSLLKNFWGKQDKEAVFLARQGVKITDFAVKEQIARFIVTVNQLYWNLVLSQKRLEIMEDSLARAEKLLSHNRKRFAMGLVEETDILQLEAVVAIRQVDVLKASDSALDAEDALKSAMYIEGVENQQSIVPIESFVVPDKEVSIGLIEDIQSIALVKRWDINQARIAIENKKYSYNARKNERLPRFDVTGGVAYTGVGEKEGAAYDSAKSGNHPVWYSGLSLQMPIGNRDASGQYVSARHDYENARLSVRKLEQEILKETKADFRRVKTSFKNIHASAKVEKLQKRKLVLEEEKFRQGRSSINMVIDFQNDLQYARLQALQSMIDYKLALITLDFTKGTLFETWGISP